MKIAQVAPLFESVPPKRVRRHGARRLLPDRSAGGAGPRRDAVRQRRLASLRPRWCRSCDRALRLDPARPRPADLAHAADRPRVRARGIVRRDPLPHRHAALAAGAPAAHAVPDHAARPPRPAGPQAAVPPSSAAIRWCRSPTASARRCRAPTGSATVHHGLPPDLYRFHPKPAGLLRLRRPHLAGEALRPRDRDRHGRAARRCASRRRSTTPTATTSSARSSRCWTIRWSTSSARSATPTRTSSSATRRRCCSRSTGPSRSAW